MTDRSKDHCCSAQAAIEDGTDRTRVTLVVSACAGDGKTSVAANLAAAMAEPGKRVVVVNGDFRRPAVAKRLLDHGYHPPTVYFPLLVDEALLIEPTETETKETLDGFAEALAAIVREAKEDPTLAQNAPYSTPVRRLDEAGAAKRPVIRQVL